MRIHHPTLQSSKEEVDWHGNGDGHEDGMNEGEEGEVYRESVGSEVLEHPEKGRKSDECEVDGEGCTSAVHINVTEECLVCIHLYVPGGCERV